MRGPGNLWRLRFSVLNRLWYWLAGSVIILLALGYGDSLAANPDFTLDFEEGTLTGWSAGGQAFQYQPTMGDNPSARNRGQPSGHQGRYWIGTYEKFQGRRGQKAGDVQGDRPTGTLTSSDFDIPRGTLSFLVGGGSSFATRVELLIVDPIEGGIRVRHASGADSETMRRVAWPLGEFSGRKGRIRIVDESSGPWGHINVDDFRFSDSSAGSTVAPLPETPPARRPLVQVPDLRRRQLAEAERMARAVRLELTQEGTLSAPQDPGTVVRQVPAPATMVAPGSRVAVWLAFAQEPLQVEVVPPRLEVIQGENAEFACRFLSAVRIGQQWWIGPDGGRHDGTRLTVRTDQLAPGNYDIRFLAENDEGRRGEAKAVLSVVARPISLQLKLTAEPGTVAVGKTVRVEARLDTRASAAAEYRFDLGDGTVTPWARPWQTVHAYRTPGRYTLTSAARLGTRVVAESEPITVVVLRSEPENTLTLKADRDHAVPGEEIRFAAVASRRLPGARFQFEFGDRTASDWQPEPEITHSYDREGSYEVRVRLRTASGVPLVSGPLIIAVRPPRPQALAVTLSCERTRLTTQQPLICEAGYSPRRDGEVSYAFSFGDGTTSNWQQLATVRHNYSDPGEYPLVARVRVGSAAAGESPATIVTVTRVSPSAGEHAGLPDDRPLNQELLWELLMACITVTIAAAIYVKRRRATHIAKPAAVLSFAAVPHQQQGEQSIAFGGEGLPAGSLHFIVAKDGGVQEIDSAHGLVAGEDGEDARGGEGDGR